MPSKSRNKPKALKTAVKKSPVKGVGTKKRMVARPVAKSLTKRSAAGKPQKLEAASITPIVPLKWTKIQTAEGWRRNIIKARAAKIKK